MIQGFGVHDEAQASAIYELLELSEPEAVEGASLGPSRTSTKLSSLEALQRLAQLQQTDKAGKRAARQEAGIFRSYLLPNGHLVQCAICGEIYPSGFLVAAHIKPRASCTDPERRDLGVVMPACKFGCDELFERGYIYVDEQGIIRAGENATGAGGSLKSRVQDLTDKACLIFKVGVNDHYFEWHRKHPRRDFVRKQ